MTPPHVYIGWDPAEMRAWTVAEFSLQTKASTRAFVDRLALSRVQALGLYTRPTQHRDVGYYDEISEAPMSTGHAIARFLVPHLCGYKGWALFMDGDVLVRRDIQDLFALADPRYAVQVVKHVHAPVETVKMTGHAQTVYARKNWSSVCLFNCGHDANRALSVDVVNRLYGRDLHRFCWLDDELIGALPAEWNWLVGHSSEMIDPAIVHFTSGIPDQRGYEHVPFSDEWYTIARACGYRLTRPSAAEAMSA